MMKEPVHVRRIDEHALDKVKDKFSQGKPLTDHENGLAKRMLLQSLNMGVVPSDKSLDLLEKVATPKETLHFLGNAEKILDVPRDNHDMLDKTQNQELARARARMVAIQNKLGDELM